MEKEKTNTPTSPIIPIHISKATNEITIYESDSPLSHANIIKTSIEEIQK